jgi:hypothetical protein
MNKHLTAAMMILLVAAGAASADVIYSSLPDNSDNSALGNYATNSDEVGGAFTTSASLVNNQLQSVTFRFAHSDSLDGSTGTVDIGVYEDNGSFGPDYTKTVAESLGFTFTHSTNNNINGNWNQAAGSEDHFTDVTWTLSSTQTLDPSTTYWVIVNDESTSGSQNPFRSQYDAPGTSEATMAKDGTSRGRYGVIIDTEAQGSTSSYGLAYEIVAIPEPATMSLLALGGLGALLRRRR